MQSNIERSRFWVGKCVLCGGLAGLIAGLFGGPVVMLADMYHFYYIYGPVFRYHVFGAMFIDRELLAAPIIGVIVGVPEGFILGLLWAVKPQRLTLWWLMVVVAGVGLQLGLFVYKSLLSAMALTFPFMIAVLIKTVGSLASSLRTNAKARHKPSPQSSAWLYEHVSLWEKPLLIGNQVEAANPSRRR
jgi:hypothetical protein